MAHSISPRIAHRGLVVLCGVWIAFLLAAPLAAARGSALAPWLYRLFEPICHQIAERSFHLGGHPLGACHRCVGLYLGFTIGLLLVPHLHGAREWLLEQPRRILVFALPMVVDWSLPFNVPASRFLTGLLAAAPIAVLAWAALQQLFEARSTTLLEGET